MRYYWISNKLFKIPSELRINVEFMQQSNGAIAADLEDLNRNFTLIFASKHDCDKSAPEKV